MSESDLSDSEILKLWRDPTFSGSFRGVRTFQRLLKTDLNIDVPERRLLNLLKTDTIYLIHQRPKRNFDRRKYNVHFYGQLVQIDLAYMFPDASTSSKYFLLAIDVFSFKIFAEPMKDKTSEETATAMKKIFARFKHLINEIQADRGKEFQSRVFQTLLKEKKTIIHFKQGKNKASFAEFGIQLVKKKLYMLLRSQLNKEWVSSLKKVTESLNNTPLKRLGWLTPNSIQSEADTVFVEKAKRKFNISPSVDITYQEQIQNQKSYRGDLNLGDYVYVDFDEHFFDKSFDVSVSLKQISSSKSGWPTL